MKILESQNAVLTNYEVHQFLVNRGEVSAKRNGREKPRRRGPIEKFIDEVCLHGGDTYHVAYST